MQQIPLKLSLNVKITIVTKTCPSFYKKHTLTNFTISSFNSFLRVVQWDFKPDHYLNCPYTSSAMACTISNRANPTGCILRHHSHRHPLPLIRSPLTPPRIPHIDHDTDILLQALRSSTYRDLRPCRHTDIAFHHVVVQLPGLE